MVLLNQIWKIWAIILVPVIAILAVFIQARRNSSVTIDLKREPVLTIRRLTDTEISDYQRDGSIIAKGLLTKDQVEIVQRAVALAPDPYSFLRFLTTSRYDAVRFDVWRSQATIASLALKSLPIVAADMFPSSEPFRLLRDAYFRYAPGGTGCGWHVDDEGFWPTRNDTSGVTIWIALDDMTDGGGLLLANRTMVSAETVQYCRTAIRGSTCDMETLAPDCQEIMERAKIQYSIHAGDAIVWDRWVYHRTDPIVVEAQSDGVGSPTTKSRYSLRFMPENSKAFGLIHSSIEQNGTFVGSPYYPQVWPVLLEAETKELVHGLDGDLSVFGIVRFFTKIAYTLMLKYLKKSTA